jgi:hypothetical protein
MNDIADSTAAIKTTVSTLLTAGVDPMAIAVSLATVSVHLYKQANPDDELTVQDAKILFTSLAYLSK